ncbi:hypothetical protein KHA80_01235 [Anaerobacillus sp. HL2]|nr:hypothetical protein KHA80_01235 [Anaerobacillus sp. HL2]
MFEELVHKNETDTNIWISYLWLLSKWQETSRIQFISEKLIKNNIQHPLIDKIF